MQVKGFFGFFLYIWRFEDKIFLVSYKLKIKFVFNFFSALTVTFFIPSDNWGCCYLSLLVCICSILIFGFLVRLMCRLWDISLICAAWEGGVKTAMDIKWYTWSPPICTPCCCWPSWNCVFVIRFIVSGLRLANVCPLHFGVLKRLRLLLIHLHVIHSVLIGQEWLLLDIERER